MTQISNQANEPSSRGCCGRQLPEVLQADFFKALCEPGRIGILVRLAQLGCSSTVSEVAACCPTNISVVSRHLAMLRDAGILKCEKRGKEVHYSVRYAELASTLRAMADAIEGCCVTNELTVTAPKGEGES